MSSPIRACAALGDGNGDGGQQLNQLSYANLGDSGLILLRHIDSEVAGTVYRDRTKPRPERKSDLRIAFLSQQQLRSFNLPYQLGYNGKDEATAKEGFEQPTDANVTGYSTRPGDIVIVATDGRAPPMARGGLAGLAVDKPRHGRAIQGTQRWRLCPRVVREKNLFLSFCVCAVVDSY